MQSVETKAGSAISCAPSRIAASSGFPADRWRWIFSIATVASSTRIPTASASPPRVIRLIVSPSALRIASEASTESGIDNAMISVPRQEPRKSRIISAVSAAAITPSRTTSRTAARTNSDWSANSLTSTPGGSPARMRGIAALTRATTSRVEAEPLLRIVSNAPRTPSRRTMFCWGTEPSRTCATSRTVMVAPLTVRTGRAFNSSTARGLALSSTSISEDPIFTVPDGSTRFWALNALTTSCGERLRAFSAARSRSTQIKRVLPP